MESRTEASQEGVHEQHDVTASTNMSHAENDECGAATGSIIPHECSDEDVLEVECEADDDEDSNDSETLYDLNMTSDEEDAPAA